MTTHTVPLFTAITNATFTSPGLTLGAATHAAPPIAGRSNGEAVQPQEGQPLGATGQGAQPSPFGGMGFIYLLLLMFVFMIGMQVFAGRKEKRRRAELLSSLGRHDRVQTIGGVIGTIAEVRDDEIVLKVDESTNTKIRVVRSAVQAVLKKGGSNGSSSSAQNEQQTEAIGA